MISRIKKKGLKSGDKTAYYYQNVKTAECIREGKRESEFIPWVSSINTMLMLTTWEENAKM